MEIVNETSFENITHNIDFDPAKKDNGKQIASTQRVRDVSEYRNKSGILVIEASIIRQTSVYVQAYRVQLQLNSNRHVTDSFCDCVSNKSEKCKHVYSVIHYVNHFESFSKTDHAQEWGKPTPLQFAKEKYSKGNYGWKMFGAARKPRFQPYQRLKLGDLEPRSSLRELFVSGIKFQMHPAQHASQMLLIKQAQIICQKSECEAIVDSLFIYAEEFEIYSNSYVLSKELQECYDENIVLSRKDSIMLSCDTLEQSNSALWFKARRPRISTSSNVHKIKTLERKTADSLASEIMYPKKLDTPATKYGLKYELKAKRLYASLYELKLKDVGVIVSPKQPWLCGSLDSVAIDEEKGIILKCVEVKCPISCKDKPIVDFENEKSNVSYLRFVGHRVELRESHCYYTQCQVQMYLTGLTECDLFVYSPVEGGSCCVPVFRNEAFLEKVIPLCGQFYLEHFLPKVYSVLAKEKNNSDNLNEKLKNGRKFTGKDMSNEIKSNVDIQNQK